MSSPQSFTNLLVLAAKVPQPPTLKPLSCRARCASSLKTPYCVVS